MTRALSLLGMTGGFLVISPSLRQYVGEQFIAAEMTLNHYSPYSYVGLVMTILALLMFGMYRSSQPR